MLVAWTKASSQWPYGPGRDSFGGCSSTVCAAGYRSIHALQPLLGYLRGLGRFRRRSRQNRSPAMQRHGPAEITATGGPENWLRTKFWN
jgi:hypothetical protein